MRRINKQKEPSIWIEYKRLHPREQYRDLKTSAGGNELRRKLRNYLITVKAYFHSWWCHGTRHGYLL